MPGWFWFNIGAWAVVLALIWCGFYRN